MYGKPVSYGTAFAIGAVTNFGREDFAMWNLISCYLSGRHDYGMSCEPGAMFLRCVHCGKRSSGWLVEAKFHTPASRPVVTRTSAPVPAPARVIPFNRASAG